jgi:hypothetical protein
VPKSDRCGTFTSAGWKRQHGGKDMPSNWRSPPRPGAKSPWGLYVHVCKMETLRAAYALAKDNDGAP